LNLRLRAAEEVALLLLGPPSHERKAIVPTALLGKVELLDQAPSPSPIKTARSEHRAC
jgi:hypothetical protein